MITRVLFAGMIVGAAVLYAPSPTESRMQLRNVQTCFAPGSPVVWMCNRADPHAWHDIGVHWVNDI